MGWGGGSFKDGESGAAFSGGVGREEWREGGMEKGRREIKMGLDDIASEY